MEYNLDKEIKEKVVYRKDAIELWVQLQSICTDLSAKLRITVSFEDGERISSATGDVLKNGAVEKKTVKSIEYDLDSRDYKKSVHVYWLNNKARGCCLYGSRYTVRSNDEEWYLAMTTRLNNLMSSLESTGLIGRFVCRYGFVCAFANMIIALTTIVLKGSALVSPFADWVGGRLIVSIVLTVWVVSPLVVCSSVHKLFPSVILELAEERQRSLNIDFKSILVNALVSIITGLIVWKITAGF